MEAFVFVAMGITELCSVFLFAPSVKTLYMYFYVAFEIGTFYQFITRTLSNPDMPLEKKGNNINGRNDSKRHIGVHFIKCLYQR